MSECPRCHQLIETDAIACPYCRTDLKAFGHPGIPLYRANGEAYLCTTCTYHEDDTCNFPQRPYAKTCTLYHNYSEPLVGENAKSNTQGSFLSSAVRWGQRNPTLLAVLAIGLISFLLAIAKR